MADYYAILTKTISGLKQNTATTRGLVFDKARTAIDKQLRAINPTPSEAAIERQMQLLEEAIAKIDAEHAETPSISPAIEEELLAAVDAPAQAEPEADVQEAAAVEPPAVSEPEVTAPTPEAPKPIDDFAATGPMDAPSTVNEIPGDPVEGSYDQANEVAQPKRRGIFVRVLPYILGLAVVGGGAYGLWNNKDPLLAALEGVAPKTEQTEQTEQVDPPKADPVEETETVSTETEEQVDPEDPVKKEVVRLGENGEDAEPEPIEVEPLSQPDNGDDAPLVLTPETAEASETETPATDPVEITEVGGETEQPAEQANEAAVTPAVAQKAFLYEEGGAGAGASRSNAAIVWTLGSASPGEGQPEEAVITGQLDIPERAVSLKLTLKRNTDEALPASHIIELIFTTPENFPGGQIENVARFVMKATEQARGEGLVAVPAKIDSGYFLIALNNLPQALETNSKLLLDSDWIDIPLVYATGRRALVTLEKGVIGERVFKEAFDDWKNR